MRVRLFRRWTTLAGVAAVAALTGVLSTRLPAAQLAPPAVEARAALPAPGDTRELVILVHGMGRSPMSMWVLERRLERDGYRVEQFGYPSTRGTVSRLGEALGRRVAQRTGDAPRVHFVGHSLGTVVIRSMLAQHRPERMGRVVMLAPPNQGAASADRWAPMVAWAMPHIRELRTDSASTARALALPRGVEVGIIAGARDAKVRVPETHLPGATDHRVVNAYHSFLMNRRDVHRMIVRFFRTGRFAPAQPPATTR